MTYSELKAAKERALQELARAEQKIAGFNEQERKQDTHYKIKFGGYILACVKAAFDAGELAEIQTLLNSLAKYAKCPKDLQTWITDKVNAIKAQSPKAKRTRKTP